MAIRILIADDHEVVAEGLRRLIEAQPGMEVVGSARDGRAALRLVLETGPDVVLMDIAMPELNGTEATRLIHQRSTQARVIVLSMYSDAVHAARALEAGASGYVTKRSAARDVIEAIHAVLAGRRYLSEPLREALIDQLVSPEAGQGFAERLSSRERQVLQMLAEGRSMSEIAAALALSLKTVETYRARMMEKLAIRDLAGLVKFAIRNGIATID